MALLLTSSPTPNLLPAALWYRRAHDRTKGKPFPAGACHEHPTPQAQAPSTSHFQATHSTISQRQPNRNTTQSHLLRYSPCAPPGNGSTNFSKGEKKRLDLIERK